MEKKLAERRMRVVFDWLQNVGPGEGGREDEDDDGDEKQKEALREEEEQQQCRHRILPSLSSEDWTLLKEEMERVARRLDCVVLASL